MSTAEKIPRGGYKPQFRFRILGTAAPVYPGFEVDILDRVPDGEKPDAVWHRDRAKAMIRAHPEIKKLFGASLWSLPCCLGAAGAQIGIAIAVGFQPWWVMLVAAYFLGSIINIMLFQLAHECDHCLVFKKPFWDRYLFTLTSIPMFMLGHHTWWVEHIVHHNDMGAKKDFITRRRSFFLAAPRWFALFVPTAAIMLVTQIVRNVLGLLIYVFTSLLRFRLEPTNLCLKVLADEHLISGYKKEGITKWAVVYPVIAIGIFAGVYFIGGWKSLLYFPLSALFFTGFLHPYCLGWVLGISHFHGRRNYQPSATHYGRLVNLATFNAGLHVEHHDIMGIPWFRLWKLRKIAPEFYDDLETIKSYTWLGLHFVFSNPKTFDDNYNAETYRNLERFSKQTNQAESEESAEATAS